MAKLEKYGDLTKKQKDLFKKYFCFGSYSIFALNSVKENFTLNVRASQRESLYLQSTWFQFKKDALSVKAKLRNDNETLYTAEWLINNSLKLKTDCTVSHKSGSVQASTSADYSHPNCMGKLGLRYFPLALEATLTAGTPQKGIGFDSKFEVESQKLAYCNLSAWWFQKYTRAVVRLEGSKLKEMALGNVLVSVYQRLSKDAHLASLVKVNWPEKKTEIEIAGSLKYDEQTLLKAKANSDGLIGLAINRELGNSMQFSAALQVDSNKVAENLSQAYKIGVKLEANFK